MGYSPAKLEAENGALTRAADGYEEEKMQKRHATDFSTALFTFRR
jgi:hypothetical protein